MQNEAAEDKMGNRYLSINLVNSHFCAECE